MVRVLIVFSLISLPAGAQEQKDVKSWPDSRDVFIEKNKEQVKQLIDSLIGEEVSAPQPEAKPDAPRTHQ